MFIIPEDWFKVVSTEKKGRGVFAQREIPAGTVLGDYLGKIVGWDDESELLYDVWRNDEEAIRPNPADTGVHLVNHSCVPNCAFFAHRGHTLLITVRRVLPDEEFTICYVLEPPEAEEKLEYLECHCGSRVCRGTMYSPRAYTDEYWEFDQQMHGEEFSKQIVPFGELLPALDSYPKYVKDYTLFNIGASESATPLIFSGHILPSHQEMRELIRETGRRLYYKDLGLVVLGILYGDVVIRTVEDMGAALGLDEEASDSSSLEVGAKSRSANG